VTAETPSVALVKDATSSTAYGVVLKKALDHLNAQGSVFVFDGAVGASKDCVNVRTVTDNAASSQMFRYENACKCGAGVKRM
jgi:hypothetical protein